MRILVIDNFDSFVYNLVQYIGQLGFAGDECTVVRNNAAELGETTEELEAFVSQFQALLLSPGPGEPAAAGRMMAAIEIAVRRGIPTFGVCLGHQAIGLHFGADVVRADELFHGKTSPVEHDGSGVLRGIPSPFRVTRYHSLTVDPATVPPELVVTARSDSGMIMAMRHRDLPIHSVQFHPESVMTQYGHRMLATWLSDAGFQVDEALVDRLVADQLAVTGVISAEASML
ncbi:anthranilate synthase component II [Corynebacterium sp. zg254]|uniref:Anthranilate synthase component II n=1 Tax=Corynebacterium zhongnanshanii TaxID=2768834 RepID=A0ABQ6VFH6_9CORY|nr:MULTISPECIES: gamma-glutamyl-gamma-aminobutyrate hydrolase family protein [Corynebacterium]KAB3519200.1 anthranilate synthase component II [Corynebacterium zhongnanshanii]MCR5915052.1 anthranilate synthase component II [Corynebacterium sp. zg254]